MSRAGKYPVKLNDGVTVAVAENVIVVKGPKGELSLPLDTKNAGLVDVVVEEGQVVINPKDAEEKSSRASVTLFSLPLLSSIFWNLILHSNNVCILF